MQSGNVGIGNSNPSGMSSNANKLVVGTGSGNQGMSVYAGTSVGRYAFARAVGDNTDAYDGGMAYDGSRNLTFHTNANAERMRIDGSGNVGIGTSSPSSKLQIMGGTSGVDQISLSSNLSDNTVKYAGLVMTMYTNNTAALIGAKAENGNTSLFYGSSGSDHRGVTKHIWYTNSNYNSTSGNTERMRIDSSGNVGIGLTSPSERLHVYSGTGNVPAKFESGDAYSIITFADTGTSGTVGTGAQSNDLIFYSGDALRMRLSSGGVLSADGVYNTTTSDAANVRVLSNGNIVRSTSSERYKNSITDASKGLTELNNLRPVTYKGNNDGETVFYGLIAEEVHDAGLTEFVEYNDDNEPDALRYPHMVSLCIKAIQEQQTQIDALQSEINLLKGE